MALVEGVFNTYGGNPAELNKRSFCGQLIRLFPNGAAQISGLVGQAGKSRAVASTHIYFTKTAEFFATTLGASYAQGASTITLVTTAGLRAGSILHNPTTGENLRVTAVNSSTVVAVTKGFGRVADAASTGSNDAIIGVGTADAEGSNRPAAKMIKTVAVTNYTQIFRNAWALTDTARASLTELGGYSNIAETRKDAAFFHSVDIEASLIWGQAKMDTSGTQPIHATQGIIDAIGQYTSNANVTTASSTTTLTQLITAVETAFKYTADLGNTNVRYAYGDAKAIKVLNEIALKNGTVQLTPETTEFGAQYQAFKCYKGIIYFKEHALLNGFSATAGRLLVLDVPTIRMAFMDGRDGKIEEYGDGGKIVENGADARGGSFTTEYATEILNPWGCCYIKGLTAGATG